MDFPRLPFQHAYAVLSLVVCALSSASADESKNQDPPASNVSAFCRGLLSALASDRAEGIDLKSLDFGLDRQRAKSSEYSQNGGIGCDLPVRDQKSYGSCWAQAGLRFFENRAARATGRYVELSDDYMIAMNLYDQAMQEIAKPRLKTVRMPTGATLEVISPLSQGAGLDAVAILGAQYGFVPKAVWSSKIPFTTSGIAAKKFLFLLTVLTQSVAQEYQEHRISGKHASSEILRFIQSVTGPLPFRFDFEGRSYNAVEFYESPQYRRNSSKGEFVGRMHLQRADFSANSRSDSARRMKMAIKKQIDETGEPVELAIIMQRLFLDEEKGILSIPYFLDVPEQVSQMRYFATQGDFSNESSHAMLVTDYTLDSQGNVDRLLALNSWGEKWGQNGTVEILPTYFEEYAQSIRVLKGMAEEFMPKRAP